MEQHPVPQDITGFQFKLIGDMTVKQFVYLASGLVIAFLISRLNIIDFVKYPLIALFSLGGTALAFGDVDKRPLDRIVVSFFKSVYRDTRYIWKKTPQVPEILMETPISYNQMPQTPADNNTGKFKLEEFLKSLPQKPKTDLDKIEEQKINSVLSGFGKVRGKTTGQGKTTASYTPPYYQSPPTKPLVPLASGYPTDTVIYPGQKFHFNPATGVKVRKLGAREKVAYPLPPQAPTPTSQPAVKPPPLSAKDYVVADQTGRLEKSTPLKKTVFVAPQARAAPPPLKTPTTPDEKRVFDLSQKNLALENQTKVLQSQVEKLRNEPLSPNMTVQEFDNTLKRLIAQLQETEKQRQLAVSELLRLKRKLESTPKNIVTPTLAQEEEKPSARFVSPTTAKRVGLPIVNYAPNVISGIVVRPDGDVLANVVMVVTDQNDNPVRAFKSNRLGQFSIATPLSNGTYTIEVEKEGFDFDIIKLELKGQLVPPIEIKARIEPQAPNHV